MNTTRGKKDLDLLDQQRSTPISVTYSFTIIVPN